MPKFFPIRHVVGSTSPQFEDAFQIRIVAADTNASVSDAATFAIALAQSDSVGAQTETTKLTFPAGNFGDTSVEQTDSETAIIRVWAASCVDNDASQTNPSRVDGPNDTIKAGVKTANVLADLTNPVVLTTGAYTACPTSGTFTTKTLRIWFDIPAGNLLTADTITIVRNTTATGDVTIFTAGAVAVDHSTGTFTADISAITLADLQTLTVKFSYQAAIVATPLTVMNVDACSVDLIGGL